jgi:hypothetical protein
VLDSGLSVMQPAVKLLPLCCKCVSCFANHRCYNPLPTMRRRSSCHFCRCTDACYLRLHDAPLICVPSQASTHNAVNRPSHREQPGRPLSEPRHRECRATRCSMLHTLTRMPHTGGCQLPPKYCCSLPSQRSPLRLVFESSRPRALQLLLRLCQLLRSTLRQPSLLRALSPAVVSVCRFNCTFDCAAASLPLPSAGSCCVHRLAQAAHHLRVQYDQVCKDSSRLSRCETADRNTPLLADRPSVDMLCRLQPKAATPL